MGTGASWYETGFDGAEREQQKSELGWPPQRLWLKPGGTLQGVFIDDDPFCCWEHGWKSASGNYESATCIVKIDDRGCPACEAAGVQQAAYMGHLTLVDCTGYQDNKGNWNRFRLIMVAPKTKVMNKLKNKVEAKGTIVNQIYQISRSDSMSPNTGDDFEHVKDADAAEMFKVVSYKGKLIHELIEKANGTGTEAEKTRKYLAHHFNIPTEGEIPEMVPIFNYANLLKPLDYGKMKAAVAKAKGFKDSPRDSGGDGDGPTADDIPF
jgi:hypothetical protein